MQERGLSVDKIAAPVGVHPDTIRTRITREKMLVHRLQCLWMSLAPGVDAWHKASKAPVDRQPRPRRTTAKEQPLRWMQSCAQRPSEGIGVRKHVLRLVNDPILGQPASLSPYLAEVGLKPAPLTR